MKLLLVLALSIFSSVFAASEQLQLRGVVREEVYLELKAGKIVLKSNAKHRNIPVKINRRPSSLAHHEQIELVIP